MHIFLLCLMASFWAFIAHAQDLIPPSEQSIFFDNSRQGAFLELGAGYGTGKIKATNPHSGYLQPQIAAGSGTLYGSVDSVKPSASQKGAVGSFSMGYNFPVFQWGMIGFIGGYGLTSLKGRIGYPVTIQSPGNTQNTFEYCQVVNKMFANAGMRLGGWIGKTLLFTKVAWTTMRLTLRADPKTSYTWYKADKPWVRGTLVGLGFDTYISRNAMAGMTFDIGLYSKKNAVIYCVPQQPAYMYSFVRPRHFIVMATLKCMFPDDGQ